MIAVNTILLPKMIRYSTIMTPIVGGISIAYVSMIIAWQQEWNIFWIGIAAFFFGLALIVIFLFTYQMWSYIQDGHARMNPTKAVLYNFIPLFQLYWLYQCIWGFSIDCNAYMHRNGISSPQIQSSIAIVYVTAWLLSPIPYLSLVTVPIAIVCVTFFLFQSIRALQAIFFFQNKRSS